LSESGLTLYPEQFEMTFDDKVVMLTKKEADIMEILLERYPKVSGREDLLDTLWYAEAYVDENTINVNISSVRTMLQDIGITYAIETIRGAGYRLVCTWK